MTQSELAEWTTGRRIAVPIILAVVLFVPIQLIVGVTLEVVSGTEKPGSLLGAAAVLFPTLAAVSLIGAVLYVLVIETYEWLLRPASMVTPVGLSPLLVAGFPLFGLIQTLLSCNRTVASALSMLVFGAVGFRFTRSRTPCT